MTTLPTSVDELIALYRRGGDAHYGEDVTQMSHALQCAALAEASGAPDALIAASLLHDVGHLIAEIQGDLRFDYERDDDDHEALGARVLAPIFGPSVAKPVALHVTAKRWRCTVEPSYYDTLSATSKATLVAQGGLLDDEACRRFEAHPGFADAVELRRFDDAGKQTDATLNPLEHYIPLLHALALANA
jgi:phosphonate degradation associated HDIG domain protein